MTTSVAVSLANSFAARSRSAQTGGRSKRSPAINNRSISFSLHASITAANESQISSARFFPQRNSASGLLPRCKSAMCIKRIWSPLLLCYSTLMIPTACSAALQLSQACKHSDSLIFFENRCILMFVRIPRSNVLSRASTVAH